MLILSEIYRRFAVAFRFAMWFSLSFRNKTKAFFILNSEKRAKLLLFNSNFGRFFRPVLLFNLILLTRCIGRFQRSSLSNIFLIMAFVFPVLVGCVLQIAAGEIGVFWGIETLYKSNYIFNLLRGKIIIFTHY